MKNTVLEGNNPTAKESKPFVVNQALAAIELGQTDRSVLNYMQFLDREIPFNKTSFIHVIPDMNLLRMLYDKAGEPFDKYALIGDLDHELGEKIEQNFKKHPDTKYHAVLEGDPLKTLLETGKEINADLLFIGQNSKKKYHSILAKNLARKIKSNAWIIPDIARPTITKILCPIDFSENSKTALETAIKLNRQLSTPATIDCIHIYEMPNLSRLKINQSTVSFENIVRSDKAEAFENLLSNFDESDSKYIKTHLRQKDMPGTAKYIVEAAKKNESDLIVIGAKGHSTVELLLLGSVTEKLLTLNTSVPTFIVK